MLAKPLFLPGPGFPICEMHRLGVFAAVHPALGLCHPSALGDPVPSPAMLAAEEGGGCWRKEAWVCREEHGVLGNQTFKSLKTSGAIWNHIRFIAII